jgi:hypothetical protein
MFYVLLAAIPLAAAATLFSFARVLDAADGRSAVPLARTQSVALSLVLALVVLAAALASPLS